MQRLAVLGMVAVLLGSFGETAFTQQQGRAEQEVLQLEREMADAIVKKDAATYRRILADDYTGVTSRGTTRNKTEEVAGLQSNTFTSFTLENLKARIYGEAAVVTGGATYSGRFEGVQYTHRQVLCTNTYARREGRWQEVASHCTLVAAQQR
jgi:ketosteroid isomerase-like protein